MFLVNASIYEGMPPRLYRTPSEIKTDINDVKIKIDRLCDMLNVRNVISEMLNECATGSISDWLPALKSIVEDAEDTLETLVELNDSLEGLNKELKETRCVMRLQ